MSNQSNSETRSNQGDAGSLNQGAFSQWRPIDTAPTDMTEVIVLCGKKDISLGWYFAPSSQTRNWLNQNGKRIKPTHWMPIPSLPATP